MIKEILSITTLIVFFSAAVIMPQRQWATVYHDENFKCIKVENNSIFMLGKRDFKCGTEPFFAKSILIEEE